MKIIEALKELPVLEKRIAKNKELIAQYASDVDTGQGAERQSLPFDTQEQQKGEVLALLQSTQDLVRRKAQLRRRLSMTNAAIKVKIDSEEMSIAEWIEFREHGIRNILSSLSALNDNQGKEKMQNTPFDPEKGIKVVRFYDEKSRNDAVEKWQGIQDKIDAQLEIVNATTDMVEG